VLDLTVPEAHCRVTCTALQASIQVIGEKPMAATMTEARRMVRAAEETGKLYMVSWRAEGFHTSWNGNWRIVGETGTLLLENDQSPRAQVAARSQRKFYRRDAEVAERGKLFQPQINTDFHG